MFTLSKPILLLLALTLLGGSASTDANITPGTSPEYTRDGQLKLPNHYPEWIYLSSDFHPASQSAEMQKDGHDKFLNVFVSPQAYGAFLRTGTWPDKTLLVVEMRTAESVSMNNQTGQVQGSPGGIAVHVKGEARFAGKWGLLRFPWREDLQDDPANRYNRHTARGAVYSTFIQFYPTLQPVAKSKAHSVPHIAKNLRVSPQQQKSAARRSMIVENRGL